MKKIICYILIVLSIGFIAVDLYSVINQDTVHPFFLKEGFMIFGYLAVIFFTAAILIINKKKNQ